MIARVLIVAALLLAGVYVGYAVSAGYVGAFPEPVNLVAGLACPVVLAAVGWRVADRRPRRGRLRS